MNGWTVTLEAAGDHSCPYDLGPALEELSEHLADHSAIVSLSPDATRYSVMLSIDDTDGYLDAPAPVANAAVAISRALHAFSTYAEKVALPSWPVVYVNACTFDEQDRALARPAFPDLVGIAEVADMFHVSRQRASELRTRTGFPPPIADLRAGPVWIKANVEQFAETWTRAPGRPRRDST